MTNFRWSVGFGFGVAIAGAAALMACGESAFSAPEDGGSTADATAEPDSSPGNDGSAGDGGNADVGSMEAGDANDAALPLLADPGQVACGGGSCLPTPGEFCCVDNADGGALGCGPTPNLSFCLGQLQISCDEAADCDAGACCISRAGGDAGASRGNACEKDCASDIQVCKSSAECKNGQPCVAQTCHGQIIETCGPMPADLCN